MALRRQVLGAALVLAAWLLGCDEKEPIKEFAPPRRKIQTEAVREQFVELTVQPASHVELNSTTRSRKLQARINGITGRLRVNLLDLKETTGSLDIDLRTISVTDPSSDPLPAPRQTALNWLELGDGVPAAVRDKYAKAHFIVRGVDSVSAQAAHQAKVVKAGKPLPLGDASAAGTANRELRSARLTLDGDLELHGYRVKERVALKVLFAYSVPATPGAIPANVTAETISRMRISLAAHDIKPRDAAGLFLANQQEFVGHEVATEWTATALLELVPVN